MPPEITRYDYRDEKLEDRLRLVTLQQKIANGEAEYQELLSICNSVHIDIPQFNELAQKFGGPDAVKGAIRDHGSDYLLYLIAALHEKEEASDPTLAAYHEGWLAAREEAVERRAAERAADMQSSAGIKKRGTETE